MKRYIMLLLAAVMLLTLLAPAAYAEEEDETTEATVSEEETGETTEETEKAPEVDLSVTSGTFGTMTWALEGATLTISGAGEMPKETPWAHLAQTVKELELTGGITVVAPGAFKDFDQLETIDFGGSLKIIGEQAFMGCGSLKCISLPATFRKFEREAFRDTGSLTEIYCSGPMPSFRGNCLGNGNYITIYHMVDNPWPQESVNQLITNLGNRIQILAGSEVDLFTRALPEEDTVPTEAPTEAVTEPVTEAPTEPETEPVTEPPTEAPTEPITEAPTEAPTEAVQPTDDTPDWREELEQTEPEASEEKKLSGSSWIGLVLIIGVMTFVIIGALVVRSMKHKDGMYTE